MLIQFWSIEKPEFTIAPPCNRKDCRTSSQYLQNQMLADNHRHISSTQPEWLTQSLLHWHVRVQMSRLSVHSVNYLTVLRAQWGAHVDPNTASSHGKDTGFSMCLITVCYQLLHSSTDFLSILPPLLLSPPFFSFCMSVSRPSFASPLSLCR